jgi:hypothetical protein
MAKKKRRKKGLGGIGDGMEAMEANPSYAFNGIGRYEPRRNTVEVLKVYDHGSGNPPCLNCGGYKVYAMEEALRHSITGWLLDKVSYQCANCGMVFAMNGSVIIPNELNN